MKNRLILVTGGARSGKSLFAEQLVAETASRKFYLATCPVFDGELAERIARHRARREADSWRTIEEQLDLGSALRQAAASGGDGILIDCLTLWINNLFFRAEQEKREFGETEMAAECDRLIPELRAFPGIVVAVLNEVGMGIVPESPLARRFHDCSGRCGQKIAAAADALYFTVCGIAQRIK